MLVLMCQWVTVPSTVSAADAKEKRLEINVTMRAEPKTSVGLLMSSQGTTEQPVTDMRRANSDTVVVTIPYVESNLPADTMVSAIVISEDGTPFYGDVRPLFSPEPKSSFLDIPECKPEKISELALQGQLSLLESLLEVRSARRGVAQVKLTQLLSDKFLEDLNKLEHGFGLSYPAQLSADSNPVELVDRLSRLMDAVTAAKRAVPVDQQR